MSSAEKPFDLVIVGSGPCGLAAAISAQRAGLSARVFDAGAVVSTITQYPYYVSFFSTAEKLSLGDVPFVVAVGKPHLVNQKSAVSGIFSSTSAL